MLGKVIGRRVKRKVGSEILLSELNITTTFHTMVRVISGKPKQHTRRKIQ
jgi:hypothetical protein